LKIFFKKQKKLGGDFFIEIEGYYWEYTTSIGFLNGISALMASHFLQFWFWF
jgi:hypothetical protein